MPLVSMVNFYPCINIDETSEFYTNSIGLTLVEDQGKAKIFDTGYGYLGFCQYDDKPLSTSTCISFNMESKENVDNYYKKFKVLNANGLVEPKKHEQFEVYSFFMLDPNGYTLEFQKIKDSVTK